MKKNLPVTVDNKSYLLSMGKETVAMKKVVLISLGMLLTFCIPSANAQPSEQQLKAFSTVKVVRIIVEKSYPEPKSGFYWPPEEFAQTFLELKVVAKEAHQYDATIEMKIEGRALGQTYQVFGRPESVLRYPGVTVFGRIILKVPGIPDYESSFKIGRLPPKNLHVYYDAYEYPYEIVRNALHDSFDFTLALLIGEVFGPDALIVAIRKGWYIGGGWMVRAAERVLPKLGKPTVEPLVAALYDEDKNVRDAAASALWKIRDARAVEPLIADLADERKGIREAVAMALKITRQDLGEDPAKWQEWWEKNNANYK